MAWIACVAFLVSGASPALLEVYRYEMTAGQQFVASPFVCCRN